MSRGRKSIVLNGSEWETVFYNSVGRYVQCINGELAKELKPEPLNKHINILGGYAFKSTEYKKQGVPIIRISDFSNERIKLFDPAYYTESKELKRFELYEGDIVIALTGGTIAKLAIVQRGLGKLYLNQRVGKFVVLNPNEFEAEYVYWIARSVQSIIKDLAWGAAIPNVSPKQIEALKFPFPRKNIQKGIIEFLNDLKNDKIKEDKIYFNELIEARIIELHTSQLVGTQISTELTRQLDLVKQLRQAFLREAMQGKLVPQDPSDEPSSELLKRIKAEKEHLVKEKKIKKEKDLPPIKEEEIPFEVPKGWVWGRLGEVGKITGGGTPSMARSEYWSGDIPWISPKDMWVEFVSDSEMKITEKGVIESTANMIPKGSILIVGRSGILKRRLPVAINTVDCTVNQDMKVVIPHVVTMNRFIQLTLRGLEEIILTKFVKYGMTVHSLKYDEFESMPIPIPPLYEQQRIVAKLEELMLNCDQLEQNIKQSQAQNERLLQQVLREALEPK